MGISSHFSHHPSNKLLHQSQQSLPPTTMSAIDDLTKIFGLPVEHRNMEHPPGILGDRGFQWRNHNNITHDHRYAYTTYLQRVVGAPNNHVVADVESPRSLLAVGPIEEAEAMLHLDGTTDVVIANLSGECLSYAAIRNNTEVYFVVGLPRDNFPTLDQQAQAASKHIAASYHNPGHPVVTVLTDLQNAWMFYWFAGSGDGVALYSLRVTHGLLARRLLGQIYLYQNHPLDHLLQTTFENRLSYHTTMEIVSRNAQKRLASDGSSFSGDRKTKKRSQSKSLGSSDKKNGPSRKRHKVCVDRKTKKQSRNKGPGSPDQTDRLTKRPKVACGDRNTKTRATFNNGAHGFLPEAAMSSLPYTAPARCDFLPEATVVPSQAHTAPVLLVGYPPSLISPVNSSDGESGSDISFPSEPPSREQRRSRRIRGLLPKPITATLPPALRPHNRMPRSRSV